MLKLLTWNLRHGGGAKGMPEITLALLGHGADVIVLTEWRRATGGQIAGVLAEHGWRHQLSNHPPHGTNGILIAARTPVKPRDDDGPDLGRRWADVALPELNLALAGVHVPCGGPDARPGRTRFFKEMVAAARARREQNFVLIGDFNAGRHGLDEEGATFTCTRYLGELATIGYVDAWRRLNPEGREYSWFSHAGNGFRIDHAHVSPALAPRVRSAWYSHSERELGLSDHSVLVIGLDPP